MKDLRELQSEELAAVVADAVGYFRDAIEAKGLVFTESLRDDFESFMVANSTVIAAEIHFNAYGRYKDMKTLHWGEAPPPLAAMIAFVEKVGVGKFAWVPGYEASGNVPTESVAIKRLARAIQYSFTRVITTRKYNGTWYNETKARMVNVARRRIFEVTAGYAVAVVKEELEK